MPFSESPRKIINFPTIGLHELTKMSFAFTEMICGTMVPLVIPPSSEAMITRFFHF